MPAEPAGALSVPARVVATLAIASGGGALFALLGVPAAWLTGATLAVAVAALARVPTVMPVALRNVVFVLLGASIGSNVTPELLARLSDWPLTLIAVLLAVLVVQAAVQLFLSRVCGWDWPTAFFSAIPGLTSYVTLVALPTSADIPRIAVLQSIRAVLLLLLIPPALELIQGSPLMVTAHAAAVTADLRDTLICLAAGAVGACLLQALKVPAGALIGAMVASGLLHGMDWTHGVMPGPILIVGLIGIGALVGGRFAGYPLGALAAAAKVSVLAALLSFATAGLCAWAATALTDVSFSELAMAFAPGGLDVMTALAFAMNLDSVFVAAHQLVRFAMIVLLVPVVTAAMLRRGYRRRQL